MASIISCSRRTDIPAFYAPWLLNRLRAGFCHTINPFGGRVYRIPLGPEDVTALTFLTRNPGPMAKYLEALEGRGYPFYFSVTITGYPRAFEAHNLALPQILRTFQQIASRLGPERMRWRYDPIVLSSLTPVDYHLRRFEEIASALQGATNHCTFSFVQYYGKTLRNLEAAARGAGIQLEKLSVGRQQSLAKALAQIAAGYGMRLNTCCNDLLLVAGVGKSHCVDPDLVRAIAPGPAEALKKRPTRKIAAVLLPSISGCTIPAYLAARTATRPPNTRQRAVIMQNTTRSTRSSGGLRACGEWNLTPLQFGEKLPRSDGVHSGGTRGCAARPGTTAVLFHALSRLRAAIGPNSRVK